MIDLRPVLMYTGLALALLAAAMVVPAAVDAVHGGPDGLTFAGSAAATLLLGLGLMAANQGKRGGGLTVRQLFLLTVSCWFSVALAAALPLGFSSLHLSMVDAVFEAVSGVTTTGATVLRGLDQASPGVLIWRSLLQWLGGIGTLVTVVVVLPALNIGGMELFRLETSCEGALPRAAKVMLGLLGIYGGITAALTLLLWAAGMSRFPALLHAMSTISCGGFSTSDGSVGHWHKPNVEWVVLVGMVLGGAPFLVYLQMAQRRWAAVLRNSQLRWYLGIMLVSALSIAGWLLFTQGAKPLPALRHGLFAAASVMTGTGYASLDFGGWRGLPVVILFILMFIGGSAGSMSGGVKVFRFQVLFANARVQLVRMLRPHTVLQPRYERLPITDSVAMSVLGFLFVYMFSFAVLSMLLGMLGLEFMPAVSSAAAALGNVGPGLSPSIGPLAGYGDLPDAAKWLLTAAMLLGRLEIFTILILMTRSFWHP